tara:strand:+ start:165 stop:350 length:186 start_codon:yes stop_codon:yes gene_type:complete
MSSKNLRRCEWTEKFPIDQLVDEENKVLTFKTEKEAKEAMESWGVDLYMAEQSGVVIERIQ